MTSLRRGSPLALAAVTALWLIIQAPCAESAAQPAAPSIWFGTTPGFARGLCKGDRDPGYVSGYSVKIFPGGQVVVWNILQSYPAPDLNSASVRRLVNLARRDGFFRL